MDNHNTRLTAMVEATTPDTGSPFESCLIEGRPDPSIIVILGASGDLTERKIIPALFNLYLNGTLPDSFLIVGCARTKMSDDDFRSKLKKALINKKNLDHQKWKTFAASLLYRIIDYGSLQSFKNLADSLRDMDKKSGTRGNRIFYLAIPPSLYKSTALMLGKAGLSTGETDGNGWSRIVVEKPFGRNLDTAIDLDRSLHEYFREHQIFRIDHYLAKETVQNILMFRFANAMFEPIWNRQYIKNINIIAAETLGVGHRAGYYEQAGILRDMFQNHMMQLLALIAMEPPSMFEADRVNDEKIKVYRSLRPFPTGDLQNYLILGQYASGIIDGESSPDYRREPGVSVDSLTPTFAGMKVFIDNWRWQGVPFYLTSGKRLNKKLTQIIIQFKDIPHSLFRRTLGEEIAANQLILGIYPDEKISLRFQTKNPGAKLCLRTVAMDFQYHQNYSGPLLDAYEKVLLDCMIGDHMLFWRQDAVELCWSFLTPVLEECEICQDRSKMLLPYESGSWGPESFKKPKESIPSRESEKW